MNDEAEIGNVLITGGTGFVGFHIAQYFRQRSKKASISVVSRNPQRNRLPGVSYHAADISNASDLDRVINETRPAVIVHTACPPPLNASPKAYQETIVGGTVTLLEIALRVPFVKAFIYTSSVTVAAGAAHVDLDEKTPLADTDRSSRPYAKCKAIADRMVLNANVPVQDGSDGGLLTACLRLSIVYGERDSISIPGCLAALEGNQTNVILGNGANLWDFVSAENAAYAHHLLAVALVRRFADPSAPKVDGEAFNITDGRSQQFWDYPRLAWEAAGWNQPVNQKPIRLPPLFLLAIAFCLEWAYWLFTLGQKRPTTFSKEQVEYSCFEHTYRIEKARKLLEYSPTADFKAGVRKAVQWSMEKDGWAARLAQCKSITNKQS